MTAEDRAGTILPQLEVMVIAYGNIYTFRILLLGLQWLLSYIRKVGIVLYSSMTTTSIMFVAGAGTSLLKPQLELERAS